MRYSQCIDGTAGSTIQGTQGTAIQIERSTSGNTAGIDGERLFTTTQDLFGGDQLRAGQFAGQVEIADFSHQYLESVK